MGRFQAMWRRIRPREALRRQIRLLVRQYFQLAFDGIFSFSYLPLIYVSKIGAVVSLLSLAGGGVLAL